MDFLHLKITNFLAIGDAPKLSLKDKGLVLIQGENEDDSSANSNGVGKSSIVDALCWCLYGETARGISGDAVINKVAKKNTRVEIHVQDGDSIYQINRYRKHSAYKNQTAVEVTTVGSSTWVDISKGTEKETQELINQIMGCSIEVFMAAIYAGQEVTPDLPKMTDKQLKTLIEEAAGVERLESAYEIARRKMNTAKDSVTIAEAARESATRRIADAQRDLDAAELNFQMFEDSRPTKAQEFTDAAAEAKKELTRLLIAMKGYDIPALEKRAGELADALAGHSKMLRDHAKLTDAENEAKTALVIAKNVEKKALEEVQKLKATFDNAETELTKPCPSCGRPGEAHNLEEYKAHLKKKVVDQVAVTKKAAEHSRVCEETTLERHKAADDFVKTIPDTSAISAEQIQIAAKIREYNATKATAQNFKRTMDGMTEKAAGVMSATNPHEASIKLLKDRMSKTEVELKDAIVALEKAKEEFALREEVVKIFSPAGVRAHILDTVTPFLNSRTSDYLSALSDGNISAVWTTLSTTAKGDLKEKFNIDVTNEKGAESFAGLSGGEKRKVRLATMLALQDLVASRATKPINLWLGDEIDDALDRSGLERLMGILERKARERGTVLVVSHSDLRDWIDQVVTVTKREGISTIEGALV